MRLGLVVAGALLVPATATAEAVRPLKASGTAQFGDIVAGPETINELRMARQVLPPTGTTPTTPGTVALAQSRTIYLNKGGVTLLPGNNDARTNRSSIATQQTQIPAWNPSATTWQQTVSCMRDMFAAYDVTIVEADPGNVPHIEAVFGGTPNLLGMGNNVAGVSPFTTDCSIIENAIVFTFTQVLPQTDSRLICEIMAQEVAHAYGLDHELLASDPMTYLNYNGNRSFQNQTASCGEDVVRPCGINGSVCRANQNSVTLLTDRLGRKAVPTDTTPPTGGITSPLPNAQVPPGFQVFTDANDDQMVVRARLFIDGAVTSELTAGPFVFDTPPTLSEGVHRLKVEVYDGANTFSTEEVTVTVKAGATQSPPGTDGSGNAYGGEITGGCSTSGSGASLGAAWLLALVGLARRRRR